MRQPGARTTGWQRNSRADPQVSGCQPSARISSSNDSRTETSSSTTKTTGVGSAVALPLDPAPDGNPTGAHDIARAVPARRLVIDFLQQCMPINQGIRGREHVPRDVRLM